ncbi:MAG: DUF1573 domain-containing protein [Lutibacter sp.]|uniref:DUF1573 domain-containing protein n=1 Tax=Lutibacter sp. TaxID=1925666 RepID=UPI001794FBFE|nr:DUF1573 domain-containing protein [Lutibacter sp.]MBT8317042.1 DUF1573 domain-containing protein [Lutibacter sp.]NNJ57902.1 DUF1573 domain-containing protein [Lutibacter sp.]
MKKITVIIITVLSLGIVSCKDNAASKIKSTNLEIAKERDAKINLGSPIAKFDKTEFEFGTIKEGEVIDGVFSITNVGKVDLLILDAKPSCGCTVPSWPKEPIQPGATAELKFKFNSRGKVGNNNKSITLKTNTEKGTEVLRVKGIVLAESK